MTPDVIENLPVCLLQVVLGVLGCPNLPQQPIQEEDGAAGVAERVGTAGIGCLFTAIKGEGAFVGPLNGKASFSHGLVRDRTFNTILYSLGRGARCDSSDILA